jgi:hypothetical protein
MKDIEMEQLYLGSMRKSGYRVEDAARSMYCGFVLTDYTLYKQAEEVAGVDVARRVHKNTRLKYIPWVVKDAFEDFRIGEVRDRDVATVGRIARRVYERTSCPFKVKEDTADRFVGIILKCPVVTFSMGLFDEKLGCPYHQSLAEVCSASMSELVSQLGQSEHVEATQDEFICRGDDHCRVIFQRKK